MSKSKFDPEFAAGFWPCIVQNGSVGEEVDNNGKATGRIKARVNVKIDNGPDKGRLVTYEDEINAKSSLYIMRSLKSVGWKGGKLTDVAGDIDAWVKATGGKSTVEIRHIEIKKGKRFDEWLDETGGQGTPPIWAKANSLGRGPRPLAAPVGDALNDAEEQMRRAMADDGAWGGDDSAGTPMPAASGSTVDPDDIPFITCSASVGLGEIAKVLR